MKLQKLNYSSIIKKISYPEFESILFCDMILHVTKKHANFIIKSKAKKSCDMIKIISTFFKEDPYLKKEKIEIYLRNARSNLLMFTKESVILYRDSKIQFETFHNYKIHKFKHPFCVL
ncbi:hypothetical protein BpHYR1_042211 [Brachionus plicatilis]|uniref:Uncharacterized protein n=1 Tax=Brachionus plicatilis TaxID=10195 RepID=A0A3M7QBE9_BRAPC|nr:hypothetical protein BpHYR1_042211 [Brachionus plicatilis]